MYYPLMMGKRRGKKGGWKFMGVGLTGMERLGRMGDGELAGVRAWYRRRWELGVDMLGDVIKHFFAKLCSGRDTWPRYRYYVIAVSIPF